MSENWWTDWWTDNKTGHNSRFSRDSMSLSFLPFYSFSFFRWERHRRNVTVSRKHSSIFRVSTFRSLKLWCSMLRWPTSDRIWWSNEIKSRMTLPKRFVFDLWDRESHRRHFQWREKRPRFFQVAFELQKGYGPMYVYYVLSQFWDILRNTK